MLKRSLVPIFLASIAGLALLTFLAASANSSPDPGLFRSNQTINRVTKPDPQLPALPGAGRVEIRGYEAGGAQNTPLGSALGDTANTQAGPDTFYGNETLYPLIDAGTMIIPLPGGARVEIRDGETTYVLTDHLGSARVVLREDNTVSGRIEYSPFGERRETGEADVVRSFTGKVFEPETGTYDFHAREYDPSSGRFTSVDAARKSISPYSYASNNPINKVDPDGLGPVYFFFYSRYRETTRSTQGMRTVAEASGSPIALSTPLEDPIKISISPLDHLQHLTVKLHGTPETVAVLNLETGRPVEKNAEEFAEFLYDRLETSSEGASQHLKSILFTACHSACRTGPSSGASDQSEISFADRFAGSPRTRTLFPELEHVIASPYRIGPGGEDIDTSEIGLDVRSSRDLGDPQSARMYVDAEQFFTGNLPQELLEPPSPGRVHSVYKRVPQESDAGEQFDHEWSEDSETISNFISSHDFTEPIFREIPVRPLIGPLTD